jgi:sporulation protein YlmC with PRC-barrel domain
MDINLGCNVHCIDGPCGKITNVVVNPVTKKVSHIVVEDRKFPENSTRLVPISKIADANQKQISLCVTKNDVADMPPFIVTRYIQETAPGRVGQSISSYYFAYGLGPSTLDEYSLIVNDTGYDAYDAANIPANELALASGMDIEATDGKIGILDELVLDSKTGEVTHILMREGHLWGKKEVSIPVSAASSAKGGVIRLKLNKKQVENLPTIPLRH